MARVTTHTSMQVAVWILAAALVISGLVEASPAVLCVGENGHADVEYGLAGCCILVAGSAERTVAHSAESNGSPCDDCADLGLEHNSLRAGKDRLPAPEANVLKTPLTASVFGSAEVSGAVMSIGIEALIASLGSVILLT